MQIVSLAMISTLSLLLVCFDPPVRLCFFFFNDTATTEIYTLSLHDALPISEAADRERTGRARRVHPGDKASYRSVERSEEHTSELQSRQYLVCRLLLEKKKKSHAHLYSTDNTGTHSLLAIPVHLYGLQRKLH